MSTHFQIFPATIRWALGLTVFLVALPVNAGNGTVTVQQRTVTRRLAAYAEVVPRSLLQVRVTLAGMLADLTVEPGDRVQADALLARLRGPQTAALLAQRQAAVDQARAALTAATKQVAITRQQRKMRLSTRQDVIQAAAAQAKARAELRRARVRLASSRQALLVRAPVTGRVVERDASAGEQVQGGETILTLRPAHNLWLRASYYGTDAGQIRLGMTGHFQPLDGGQSIAVRVVARSGALRPDGGRRVELTATMAEPGWFDGEAGTLRLDAGDETLVAVPSRALVLDQGSWWVLVRSSRGEQRRRVEPGPSRGDWTLIRRGLAPGTEVVVDNAYLRFHRQFARHYQAPD